MLYDPKWKTKHRRPRARSEVYAAAAEIIQARGHSLGQLEDAEGRMCVWGAISFVMDGNACSCSKRSHRMIDHLYEFTGGRHPISWNNKPGRTKRQVINMLRRAARAFATA